MKFIKIYLFCLIISSCVGYLPDGSELIFENKVVGNIRVEQARMSERPSLIFNRDSQGSSYIVHDCLSVTYDTINKRIFVKEYLNEWNSAFYQITVLDTITKNSIKAFNVYKLEETRFKFLKSKCLTCKEIALK